MVFNNYLFKEINMKVVFGLFCLSIFTKKIIVFFKEKEDINLKNNQDN
jgi:hypothetical protein